MKYSCLLPIWISVICPLSAPAQISDFPYSENFDTTAALNLPSGWSAVDFEVDTSVYRSRPKCIGATGNMTTKSLTSPPFDFTNRIPNELLFWERRSPTASDFRFEVRASSDGVNFDLLIAVFDKTTSTTNYIQRIVNLKSSALQNRPSVQIQWRLSGDGANKTGVLRVDDVSLTMSVGFDVEATGINISPPQPVWDDPLIFSTLIKNTGVSPVPEFSIRFFHDENNDGKAETDEEFSIRSGLSLNEGDSLVCTVSHSPLRPGIHCFITVVDCIKDENHMNDTLRSCINIGCKNEDVVVNEIMYNPLAGQNEWLEFFNRSEFPIDLSGWFISDRSALMGGNTFEISGSSLVISPGSFALVAAESTVCQFFPELWMLDSNMPVHVLNKSGGLGFNNDGDIILLTDFAGRTIDSVSYSDQWNNPNIIDTRGRSLERINPNINSNDPRNWSTCTNILGGTPLKPNSIYTSCCARNGNIYLQPNPFSPDGDGHEDFCIIHFNLPMITSTLYVRIYDIKGRLIRTLSNGEVAGANGEVIWDGLDNNKQKARIGVYIILLEACDIVSGKTSSAKAVAVVAARL